MGTFKDYVKEQELFEADIKTILDYTSATLQDLISLPFRLVRGSLSAIIGILHFAVGAPFKGAQVAVDVAKEVSKQIEKDKNAKAAAEWLAQNEEVKEVKELMKNAHEAQQEVPSKIKGLRGNKRKEVEQELALEIKDLRSRALEIKRNIKQQMETDGLSYEVAQYIYDWVPGLAKTGTSAPTRRTKNLEGE